ncbi:MAG: exopolysaccharide biosynthesis protein [Lysobacteraceae bacterium]|nr:MAG: exopolysaccharide biosynthesis protein [Xanthomonadaceae bacterium]
MTKPSPDPGTPGEPGAASGSTHTAGTRAVLDAFAQGDPDDHLRLGDLLSGLRQTAFGMLLFVAVLPAFIPIPGVAGAISGPLVALIGLQLLVCLRKPWLPGFLARRGPHRKSMMKFRDMMARWLRWLEKLVRPRMESVLDHPVASAFTGLLLILLGVLLALPIPFTNYLFGVLLLLFVFALLERDGALMLVAWLAGAIAIVVFGFVSGNLVQMLVQMVDGWF